MKTTPWNKIKGFIKFIQTYELCKDIKAASIECGYVLKDFTDSVLDYYVYLLVNPITNKIFYVGKGKGNRALQHYKDYKRCKEKNSFKYKEIQSFAKLGFKPIVKIVADNLEESIAYRIETKLIKRLYKDLTNISQNENEPNILKREIKRILRNLPSYDTWLFGVALNKPLVYQIFAVKGDYGKGIYDKAVNCLKTLAEEYEICQTNKI